MHGFHSNQGRVSANVSRESTDASSSTGRKLSEATSDARWLKTFQTASGRVTGTVSFYEFSCNGRTHVTVFVDRLQQVPSGPPFQRESHQKLLPPQTQRKGLSCRASTSARL
jgi:hypothetical protein